jgi:Reeler domain
LHYVTLFLVRAVKLVATTNKTYFEGFFVQARYAVSDDVALQLSGVVMDGTFDTNGDKQLQALSCGNQTTNVGLRTTMVVRLINQMNIVHKLAF